MTGKTVLQKLYSRKENQRRQRVFICFIKNENNKLCCRRTISKVDVRGRTVFLIEADLDTIKICLQFGFHFFFILVQKDITHLLHSQILSSHN